MANVPIVVGECATVVDLRDAETALRKWPGPDSEKTGDSDPGTDEGSGQMEPARLRPGINIFFDTNRLISSTLLVFPFRFPLSVCPLTRPTPFLGSRRHFLRLPSSGTTYRSFPQIPVGALPGWPTKTSLSLLLLLLTTPHFNSG